MNNHEMHDDSTTIQTLKDTIEQFVKERDWSQYHNPKNLSMSIAIEAAELMEKFQFISQGESFELVASHQQEIAHELVDILAYVMSFANVSGIDIASRYHEKMQLNNKKYPVETSSGDYGKYTKLRQ